MTEMADYLEKAKEPGSVHEDEGYEYLTCIHHTHLRWQRRKFDGRRISNNPHLMFLGDAESGLPGHILGAKYGDGETTAIECPCPYSELRPL